MTASTITRRGALSLERMNEQLARCPDYRAGKESPAIRFQNEARRLWGGRVTPMMASAESTGRFARAAINCPPTACTGSLELAPGARSAAWRNLDAIENIICAEGSVTVRFGQDLQHSIALGLFDMVSVPAGVRHTVASRGDGPAKLVQVLSIAPGGTYDAVFHSSDDKGAAEACGVLGVRFDTDAGLPVSFEQLTARTTRFATLVPYKKDLSRTSGLPAEATQSLSAGSVYPLIVPEGHIGRSSTAPIYGHQGLYISIAECTAGDDGPPPHAHSDTQESFYILDGSFDMCSGLDNETAVQVGPHDLLAMPNKVMRTFRNTSGKPARLLVIIQGPDRMQDIVSFSRRIGEDFERRFGRDIIDTYAKIRMTFDAEDRLGV